MTSQQVDRIIDLLIDMYPDAKPELNFSNPYETLVATILSAQCTDKRVNKVTEKLFPLYPDAFAMAGADVAELEGQIRECGLYHMKAKNIIGACREIANTYAGRVPDNRKDLMKLPGVGQKTAGVVLLAAFGDDQIPVDTHVLRVSNRIGLAHADTPEKTEIMLREVLPRDVWSHAHHLIIFHGRRCCHARKPECDRCPLRGELCEYSAKAD